MTDATEFLSGAGTTCKTYSFRAASRCWELDNGACPWKPRFAIELKVDRLHSRFTAGMGQRVHFFFVDFDLARFLHLVAHVGDEQPK